MSKRSMAVLALSAALLSVSQASVLTDLARMRTTYTNELAKIEKDSAESLTSWCEQYSSSLRNLEQYYQKAGQLMPLIAVKNEMKRFVDDRTIDELSITNTYPDLYRVQKAFAASGKALPANRETRIAQLKLRYDKNLLTLQENLTRQGDYVDALTVKNTRDMLQRPPEDVVAPEGQAIEEPATPGANALSPPGPAADGLNSPSSGDKTQPDGSWAQAEARILERFGELSAKLQRQDDTVVALVDPSFLAEHGAKDTRLRLRFLFPHLVTADPSVRVQATVSGSLSDRRAELAPFVMTGSTKKEFPVVNWFNVGGEWYIKLGAAGGR